MTNAIKQLTGGEAIVQGLRNHNVDTLFGLPGVQNDWLYNALYDQRDHIRVIHTRHEQGAGYMALGYAMARGDVGVCSVVPGPGFLNASAALATAAKAPTVPASPHPFMPISLAVDGTSSV